MSADAFRDAINDAIATDLADGVIAMPEMEAIRRYLLLTHGFNASGLPRVPPVARRVMAGCGLSESVIDWVLGDES